MRIEQLQPHEGIAARRYLARLSLDRDALTGFAGSRVACLLSVENRSPSEWRVEGGRPYSIGVRLRSHTGPVLHEPKRILMPLHSMRPWGKETVLLDVELPNTPGLYELFVDVVEEGVCWFSERGSPPLICEVEVLAGPTKARQYRVLTEHAHLALLGQKPAAEAGDHWRRVLEVGGRLEWLLAEICQGAVWIS
jgi:hypothetical protein